MRKVAWLSGLLSIVLLGGCPGNVDIVADFNANIQQLVAAAGPIQTEDPPDDFLDGETVIIDNSVTIIENPSQQIIIDEVPDINVIGFINDTGLDIYVRYFVDGEFQAVYVFNGEALLLEYDCIGLIELDSEEDVDPFTGVLVDGPFDLSDIFLENGFEFFCGDAILFTFDPFEVSAEVTLIELL
jgi:hypothetical protein